ENDVLTWSDSVYDIYGVSRMSFMPSRQNVMQFIPEPERSQLQLAIEEASQNKQIMSLEHSIIRPDGTVRMVYEIGDPEYDRQGNLIRFHGSVQDITERKQAEQETLRAKNLLQSTLENIPEMIFSADTQLNMLYVSPQCRELTGYTEEQFVQQPDLWCSIMYPEDRSYTEQHILPSLLSGERQHLEVRITTQ